MRKVIRVPFLKWDDAPEWGYKGFRYLPFLQEKFSAEGELLDQYVQHDVYTEDELNFALARSCQAKACMEIATSDKYRYKWLTQEEFTFMVDDLIRKKELPYVYMKSQNQNDVYF